MEPQDFLGLCDLVRRELLEVYPQLLDSSPFDQGNRARLEEVVLRILISKGLARFARGADLAVRVCSEVAGLGPLEPVLALESVTEIMVNGPEEVYIERSGQLVKTEISFRNNRHVEDLIARIVAPLGRRVDRTSPFVDARLPDGSRIHAIIEPLSVKGPVLTIRRFQPGLSAEELTRAGTWSEEIEGFLTAAVRGKLNIIVSGGTSSGKTTTLNALSGLISRGKERIITIEDSAELQLAHEHVISLEARPPNLDGRGEVTIRKLLKNALRMRPDRIIIGECRGAEAFDLLQAMNTGHGGSMSTVHANSAKDALSRLAAMAIMAAEDIPYPILHHQVREAVDIVVHQQREADGRRRVREVCVVSGLGDGNGEGQPPVQQVFSWTHSVGFRKASGVKLSLRLAERLGEGGGRGDRGDDSSPKEVFPG